MKTKQCTKCGQEKPESDFYKHGQIKSGLYPSCKICAKKSSNAYYKDNTKKVLSYQKMYYRTNIKSVKAYRKRNKKRIDTYAKTYREANPKKIKAYHKKHAYRHNEIRRSKKAKLPATLTESEWQKTLEIFNNKCVYCGDDWKHQDHLIPLSKGGGYVKENIVPACVTCNLTKGSRHPSAFYKDWKIILNKLKRHHGIKK